jgi:hypothetical protein
MTRSLCALRLSMGTIVAPCFMLLSMSSLAIGAQQIDQQADLVPVDVLGHWVGTYFQDNIISAYPMELVAVGSAREFAITLDWPTLRLSRTVGRGTSNAGSVNWSEEQLTRGRDIILDGHYQAVPLDQDTLVGIYEYDSRRMGSFILWRTHSPSEPPPSDPQSQAPESPIPTAPPSQQLAALQREYCTALEACRMGALALEAGDQRNYYRAHAPNLGAFADRFRALADANPKTPVAAQALEWIVQNDRVTPEAYHAIEQLIEDHGASVELARACFTLTYDASPKAEDLLERIRTQPSMRGRATFALAEYWLLASERQTALDARGARLSCSDAAKKAEELFEEVKTAFADEEYFANRKLEDAAQGALLQMRRVAIGKIAPEIEAEDLDGVKFKLSDYRGKVVVLDFWGHW